MSASAPVEPDEFESLMAECAPFEVQPHVAVACSGGADSMALTLLIAGWAAARNGLATALVVDHGLRAESATEAGEVVRWLSARGIAAVCLSRGAAPLRGNTHAAARDLRYRLMGEWCRKAGVLHLALGHHREDQAETLLARLVRGSGIDGLAAMAPVQHAAWGRLVRPLLFVPAARLRATLAAAGQVHVEDPSNRDPRFQRTRLRALIAEMGEQGTARLAATARRLGRARADLDARTCELLARSSVLKPEGYAVVSDPAFFGPGSEIALRALSRLLISIGGRMHPPREASLERLAVALIAGGSVAATLAGCRVLRRRGAILVCREPAAVVDIKPAVGRVEWDGRFRIDVAHGANCEIRRLGRNGWLQLAAAAPALRASSVPPPVRPSLPALWRDGRVRCVPHLGYVDMGDADLPQVADIYFRPMRPLASPPFAIGGTRPIL
ncbi:MAG: tRNA lysidine(34) synthetase TilS [Alphaproteobacteria bacterium]